MERGLTVTQGRLFLHRREFLTHLRVTMVTQLSKCTVTTQEQTFSFIFISHLLWFLDCGP